MLGPHFYNETIRKTVVAFGTLFNNIEVKKIDPATKQILESEKVPLAYGPKEKFLRRLEENPTASKPVAITLPRMYFEMTNIGYDASRKVSPIKKYKNIINENGNEVRVQYVPVPYNIEFELGIMAKSSDTALQILEQILPYFQPNFNMTINMISDMDEKKDVAVVLNNISYADDWTDDFMQKRSIVWTLNFTAKSYIYGPFNQSDIIRKAIIFETVGDLQENRRNAKYTYTPKALTDQDGDGDVDAVDDLLLTADDDFGFNGEIDLL